MPILNISCNHLLCPVKIICCLRSYQSSVNTFIINGNKTHLFTRQELLKKICLAGTSIGPEILGLTAEQIGLH